MVNSWMALLEQYGEDFRPFDSTKVTILKKILIINFIFNVVVIRAASALWKNEHLLFFQYLLLYTSSQIILLKQQQTHIFQVDPIS